MLSNFSGINTTVTQGVWDPTKTFMIEFKGKDENYGKPPEGSLTEARAKKACRHITHQQRADNSALYNKRYWVT